MGNVASDGFESHSTFNSIGHFPFDFICQMSVWPTKQNDLSLDLSALFTLQLGVRASQRTQQNVFVVIVGEMLCLFSFCFVGWLKGLASQKAPESIDCFCDDVFVKTQRS